MPNLVEISFWSQYFGRLDTKIYLEENNLI